MKNRIIIVLIIVLIPTILVMLGLIINIGNSQEKVIIESSQENTAWSYRYFGIIILNDGTIYDFISENEKDLSYNMNFNEKIEKIKSIGTKRNQKVEKEDLDLIKEYSKSIKKHSKYTTEREENEIVLADAGKVRSDIYINGKKYILYSDFPYKDNVNKSADELQLIINKYLK